MNSTRSNAGRTSKSLWKASTNFIRKLFWKYLSSSFFDRPSIWKTYREPLCKIVFRRDVILHVADNENDVIARFSVSRALLNGWLIPDVTMGTLAIPDSRHPSSLCMREWCSVVTQLAETHSCAPHPTVSIKTVYRGRFRSDHKSYGEKCA